MLDEILAKTDAEKEQLIDQIRQEAQTCETEIGGCARCTLFALQKYLSLCDQDKTEPMLRSASTLSGGIAGAGEVCGALTGGIMAIGLAYGSGEMTPVPAGEEVKVRSGEASDRAYELLTRFQAEFGSIYCRDIRTKLLGRPWQLRNVEYHLWASQKQIHDKCGEVTYKGAELAAGVILAPIENIPRLMPPE